MAEAHFFVISYDIPEDRRRNKVHKILKSYGQWMQYSLFECCLTDTQRARMWSRLEQLIEPATDNIRLYHLCGACSRRVERIGGESPQDDLIFFV